MSPYSTLMSTEAYPGYDLSDAWVCKICKSIENVKLVAIPYVLKYLVAELASVNIKVKFDIK